MDKNQILVGMKYSLKTGKNNTIAVVISYDSAKEEWTCETASGKTFTVKDAARFIEPVEESAAMNSDEVRNAEAANDTPVSNPPEAENAAPVEHLEAAEDGEQESKPEKSIFEKARAAQIAAEHGFLPQAEADALAAEAASEMARLSGRAKELTEKAEAAGAKAGSGSGGGRCKGQMSGLDAAYKILAERGEAMNAKAIANAAIEQGLWSPNGATPEMTTSAALQMDAKKGDKAQFEKTRPGYYNIRIAQ
ncbi:MAG: winged helix-turn-helix domain-containing protein [Planctomycetaceae bacterium]|jgi:hypothetical protein|nr:winged helix-turn-helix domain-containing protein [Planctomycetaceae bacterium]